MRAAALLGLWVLLGCPRTAAVGYAEPPADGAQVTDPVSGEACEKTPLTEAAVYQDRTYYFCGAGHRPTFVRAPETYVR